MLLLIGIAAGGYYVLTLGQESTDDAFVDGDIYTLTPRVAGYVDEVLVGDNEKVEKDQVLVRLDPQDFDVRTAQAKADLEAAAAKLEALRIGVPLEKSQTTYRVEEATSNLDSLDRQIKQAGAQKNLAVKQNNQAVAELKQAILDRKRTRALVEQGVRSASALDSDNTRVDVLEEQVEASKAAVNAATHALEGLKEQRHALRSRIGLAQTGTDQAEIRSREVLAQEAVVELAKARLEQARLQRSYTVLRAPCTGYVTRKSILPGRMVAAGQKLMYIVARDPGELWITANYKETQLTHVRPGQKVEVRVDTYPDARITGTVASIMSGTGAQFSLFPPENASGNYVKVVQRIPVKILLTTPPDKLPELRVGMSVVPTIFTR